MATLAAMRTAMDITMATARPQATRAALTAAAIAVAGTVEVAMGAAGTKAAAAPREMVANS